MLWGGAPQQLLAAAAHGRIELYTCDELLTELLTVLQRAKFLTQLELAHSTAQKLTDRYRALSTLTHLPPHIPNVCRDRNDDVVLACAKAIMADAIVSGDKDLLTLGIYGRIRILRAKDIILPA
jgi:putative PIN family toxin of toxin-antitoxin system